MLDQLLGLFKAITAPHLLELWGAAFIVAGFIAGFGLGAGMIVAGVALVLKAADTERRRRKALVVLDDETIR